MIGNLLLAKYNPYHDEKGRFTSEGGATFTSTGNAKAVERMKAKHAEQKAKEKPKLSAGHTELKNAHPIIKETDKAVLVRDQSQNKIHFEVKKDGETIGYT